MSNDIKNNIEEVFGISVRKADLSDFPPEVVYMLGLLGLDIHNAYLLDTSKLDSNDSKN